MKRDTGRVHVNGAALLFPLAIGLALVGGPRLLAQDPGGSGDSLLGPPTKASAPKPSAPPPEDDSALPWILAGVTIAVLVGGGIVTVVIVNKRQREGKGAEAVVPDKGVLLGGYRFQTHLMTGNTSQVWEVVEATSGRHFAMKILLPEKARDSSLRQALYHEAEVGQKMAHPNIIRIVKVERNPNNPHFVMEFFPSGSLKLKIMHKQHAFIREHVDNIFKQAATGLAFMNAKGWVHRDIKPDNILVNAAGEVRIIDFALALPIPKGLGRRFKKPKCQGTRSYMSPEQILCRPFDGRADIYSFGATAYEIVTGRPPFRGADARDLLRKHLTERPVSPQLHNPDVTKEFSELVLYMLAKKPDERPRDFHQVLMALKNVKVFKTQTTQPSAP